MEGEHPKICSFLFNECEKRLNSWFIGGNDPWETIWVSLININLFSKLNEDELPFEETVDESNQHGKESLQLGSKFFNKSRGLQITPFGKKLMDKFQDNLKSKLILFGFWLF